MSIYVNKTNGFVIKHFTEAPSQYYDARNWHGNVGHVPFAVASRYMYIRQPCCVNWDLSIIALGLLYCSNSTASVCDLLKLGDLPVGGASNDYGIYTENNAYTLGFWSSKSSASGSISTQIIGDINAASINNDHKILSIGWVNNSNLLSEVASIDGAGYFNSNSGKFSIGEYFKCNTNNALSFYSPVPSASGSVTFEMCADTNVPGYALNQYLLKINWQDNSDVQHHLCAFEENGIMLNVSSSTTLLGCEGDWSGVEAVVLGTELEYSTPGAKLLSITTAERECNYVAYDGSWAKNISFSGSYEKDYTLTELVTILSGSSYMYTTATIQIPADCQVKAISSRVVTTIPSGALSWSLGVPGDLNRYGDALALYAGSTYSGMNDGVRYYPTASELIITTHGSCPSSASSDISGSIRIVAHLKKIIPPTG